MKFSWFAFVTLSIADECFDLCVRQFPSEHCDTYCKNGDICHALHWTSFSEKNGISMEQFAEMDGPPVTCTEAREYLRLPPLTTTTTTTTTTTSTTRGYPIDDMSFEDIIDETFESMSTADQLRWMRGLGWNV